MHQTRIGEVVRDTRRTWIAVILRMHFSPSVLYGFEGDDVASHREAFHLREARAIEQRGSRRF